MNTMPMPRYTGTKTLFAIPMTRGQYNAYRGWNMPANENPADSGYLVEYEDGGKANDSRHAGYISWSPADVFERTYKPVPTDYRDRVRLERERVAGDLQKLEAFLASDKAHDLNPADRDLMREQASAMTDYRDVLDARIARFEPATSDMA